VANECGDFANGMRRGGDPGKKGSALKNAGAVLKKLKHVRRCLLAWFSKLVAI
jgi:hypothetical protein